MLLADNSSLKEKIKGLPREDQLRVLEIVREKRKRARWRANPLDYIEERLGLPKEHFDWSLLPEYRKHKWDGTPNPVALCLNSLAAWKWVCMKGAKGTGKTLLAACIMYWFLESFDDSIVVTTAPKESQLELHLWKEATKLYPKFNRGELASLRLRMIPGSDEWAAQGFVAGVKAQDAAASATRAHGFHAEHMLIITEETNGIFNQVMSAFEETCSAPHNLMLALGNPNHPMDELSKFSKLDNVETISVSAYDHPNIVLGNPNYIPGAISMIGINRLLKKYGERSPYFISRVKGQTPTQAEDSLIKLEWVCDAIERDRIVNGKVDHVTALGVDVSNSDSGDEAAIASGHENILLSVEAFACPNSNDLGHKVQVRMVEQGIEDENVAIDGVGVGAGTINTLKEYGREVINVQGGPVPDGKEEQYYNMRAQVWWHLREDLRKGLICLPDDEELKTDLITPKYTIQNGKILIESKDDIRRRIGRSPNKGDCAAYWNWARKEKDSDGDYKLTILEDEEEADEVLI